LRDRSREAADPAGDPEHEQHDADHDPGGGDLARPQAACQDHGRDRLHRLYRQRQAIEQARGDQEGGKAEQHPGWGETGHGHRTDDMRDEGAEITARATAFQEEATARHGPGKLSHELQIPEMAIPRP